MAGPWAVIRNAQTPIQADTPSVWAPIPEQPMEQSDTRSQNVVNHFGEGPGKPIPPALQSRLDEPGPMDQDISNTQEQLRKVRYAQTHPWGTPENHPGKLGKLAHVFSEVGNIAGNIVAPGVMARIPQTQLGMKTSEEELTGRLNEEEKNKALENQEAATTAHLNAETPEVAPNAESLRNYQSAETRHANAQAADLENPAEQWAAVPNIIGPHGEPVEMEKTSGNFRLGDIQGAQPLKQPKPDTPEQQYIDEYQKLHPGATVAAAERAYTLDTQRPPQQIMLVPGKTPGTFTAQNIQPGTTVQPGAVTGAGLSSLNVPSSSTRTMVETAPRVLDLANRSEQLIQQQIQQLGPAASRWNEFMAGKVGAPNPQFTQLRTNIGLLSTALMRMHVGARGGERIMEHFQDLIDSSKQSPENLIAALEEIKLYANEVKGEMPPGTGVNQPGSNTPAAPSPAPQNIKRFNPVSGRLE